MYTCLHKQIIKYEVYVFILMYDPLSVIRSICIIYVLVGYAVHVYVCL